MDAPFTPLSSTESHYGLRGFKLQHGTTSLVSHCLQFSMVESTLAGSCLPLAGRPRACSACTVSLQHERASESKRYVLVLAYYYSIRIGLLNWTPWTGIGPFRFSVWSLVLCAYVPVNIQQQYSTLQYPEEQDTSFAPNKRKRYIYTWIG